MGVASPHSRLGMPSHKQNPRRLDGGPVVVEVQQDEARAGGVRRLDGEPAQHGALPRQSREREEGRMGGRARGVEIGIEIEMERQAEISTDGKTDMNLLLFGRGNNVSDMCT